MKMTRSKLKGIVKECLVEILSEGIGTDRELSSTKQNSLAKKRLQRENHLREEKERLKAHRDRLETSIESTVSNLTENSVMRDILADTARTTLQEQMNHDRGPGASSPGINLDNIFSESSQVWSQLAFTDKK